MGTSWTRQPAARKVVADSASSQRACALCFAWISSFQISPFTVQNSIAPPRHSQLDWKKDTPSLITGNSFSRSRAPLFNIAESLQNYHLRLTKKQVPHPKSRGAVFFLSFCASARPGFSPQKPRRSPMPFCPTAQKERKKKKKKGIPWIGDPCHTQSKQICSKFSTPVAGTRLPASTMTESVALRLCFVQRGCVCVSEVFVIV